jgi:peptidoglycan hydrolase-like protein with peptidoglycan-binding domain
VILRGAISITPSISAPEGSSCGCGTGCGSSCDGGCGPSCGCAACRARWGGEGAFSVIDDTPIQSIGMDPITAQMVGYPRGFNTMVEGRNLAAERAEGLAPEVAVAVVPSGGMRAPKQTKNIIARGAMGAMGNPAPQGYPAEGGLTPDGIADIQRKLTLLGFTGDCGYTNRPLAADGIIGNSTRLAVRAFQRAQGLAVDGVLWPQTQAAIHAAWGNRPATDADIAVAYDALNQQQAATMGQKVDDLRVTGARIGPIGPSGDVRPPWAMSYTPAQWAALGPYAREAARVMHAARGRGAMPAAPSGALAAPPQVVRAVPWDMLTAEERQRLFDAAMSRSGISPSGAALPAWAASAYSQSEWDALGAERRIALIREREGAVAAEEARRREAEPGAGWGLANTLITAGTNIFNTVMNNDAQAELARIRAAADSGNAAARTELERFTRESNERIANLLAEASRNNASGNSGNNTQITAMVDALRAMQSGNTSQLDAAREELRRSQAAQSSNTTMMVGAAAAVGLAAILLLRKK